MIDWLIDIQSLMYHSFWKNECPSKAIDIIIFSCVNQYLINKLARTTDTEPAIVKNYYFKPPYIGYVDFRVKLRNVSVTSLSFNAS